jgi:hypothetical protein
MQYDVFLDQQQASYSPNDGADSFGALKGYRAN